MINLKTEWGEVKDLIPFFILNTYLNMANINKIRISGTSYDIQDKNAAKTVTLTQAEYDALTVKDPNVFYVISDSEYNFDGYWTSAQTNSAITEAVSGKADSSSVYLKSETSGATEISTALNDKLDATAYTPTDLSNYYTTAQTNTKISQAVSGKTNQSDFSGHTANTTVHVTAQDKTNWNNKSDFSGSYNDLTDKPTIPTVPTSNTAFTNDAGYITSSALNGYATTGDVQTATNDMATKTWVGQQGYLTEHQSLTAYSTTEQVNTAISQATSGKTNNTDFTGHTANTTVHVTAQDKTNWNAKSDFSGSYNDLTDKPTSNTAFTNDAGYLVANDITGKTNQSDFTAHTSNTSIHVTAQDKTNWNAKSNFSGSYNDLTDKPTIPTVPTSNTAFTNDAGYITDSALEDYATESYVTNGLDGKQDTLESGVNIKTVNNYSLLGSGNINIGGTGSNNVVELTQAEYDALDPKDPSAFYIITDAEGGDLANYMTSAQTTSAITQAVSGKTDNSDFTAHTGNSDIHVTSAEKAAWNAKSDFSGSYNDLTNKLSAGTNVTIIDNVINASGGGSITIDPSLDASSTNAVANSAITNAINGRLSSVDFAETNWAGTGTTSLQRTNNGSTYNNYAFVASINQKPILSSNYQYVNKFSLVETSAITTAITSSSTDAQVPSAKAVYDQFGGLKLVKLTQSEYDGLATKDNSTLYVIVN